MNNKVIKVGSRESLLAQAQTDMVIAELNDLGYECEKVLFKTTGDKMLDRPLRDFGGKAVFVTEIEDSILADEIDIAVHSAKDMPGELADGLCVAACFPREDEHDVLVTRRGTDRSAIRVLGTSSLRRQCQVGRYLPGVEVKDLRGNVPTRIRKLKEGEYDAIILAAAGLRRLGIDSDPELDYEYIDVDKSLPAAGQGIIAIECREDGEIYDIVSRLNRKDDMTRLMTEREFMRAIGADCHDAVAAYSEILEGQIHLNTMKYIGSECVYISESAPQTECLTLARNLGAKMLTAQSDVNFGTGQNYAFPVPASSKVYLIGAGPGDPELVTLKALKLVREADAVIYDSLIPREILDEARKDAELIDVGKRMGKEYKPQEWINNLIIETAGKYNKVVRLKGGDPFVFGRGGEEAIALDEAGIRYEVIPGVTSAVSVPEHAGIPVTHRKEARSFTVITGHTAAGSEIDYSKYAGIDGTLVFLMGLNNIPTIRDGLIRGGMSKDMPAAVISSGFAINEKTVRGTLRDIEERVREAGLVSPAIIVVGKVTEHDFSGRSKPPARIGVVGTNSFTGRMAERLEALGADAVVKQAARVRLKIQEEGYAELKKALTNIEDYGYVLFASQNAIDMFFDAADEEKIDRRRFAGLKMAVVGGSTAKWLRKYGYDADIIPADYTIEALAAEMADQVGSRKVLAIRAVKGNEILYKVFDERDVSYDKIMLYDSVGEAVMTSGEIACLSWLIFGSGSGVDVFFDVMESAGIQIPQSIKFACIGGPTADALAKHGYAASISAEKHTADELAKLVAERIGI